MVVSNQVMSPARGDGTTRCSAGLHVQLVSNQVMSPARGDRGSEERCVAGALELVCAHRHHRPPDFPWQASLTGANPLRRKPARRITLLLAFQASVPLRAHTTLSVHSATGTALPM